MLSAQGWPVVLCGLAAALGLAGGATVGAGTGEADAPEAPAIQRRIECFELRRAPGEPALGFASLYRSDSAAGTQLEWQISFPGDVLNIWHVESSEAQGQRLVWRERQARNSRSVVADRVGATVEVTEWGRPSVWRTLLTAPGPCWFPLEFEERLRAGELDSGTVSVLDPLSNALELVRVEVVTQTAAPSEALRRVELLRADGSLAASWTFLGRELVGFQWQRGGLIAVRVDEAHFAARKHAGVLTEASPAPPGGR